MKKRPLRGDETGRVPRALAAELGGAFACVLALSRDEDPVWEDCVRAFLGLSARPRVLRFEDALEAFANAQRFEDELRERVEDEDPGALKARARTKLMGALCAFKTERRPYRAETLHLFRACMNDVNECLRKLVETPALSQEERLCAVSAPALRWDPKAKRLINRRPKKKTKPKRGTRGR